MSTIALADFLSAKAHAAEMDGFEPVWMPSCAKGHQAYAADWSLRLGRGGAMLGCGLGKTLIGLIWAENVARKTGKPVLILAPLAVAPQWVTEGDGSVPDRMRKYDIAGNHIDPTLPMASIFLTKGEAKQWGIDHGQAAPIRPLAENTFKRIARGVMRFVINNPKRYLRTIPDGLLVDPFTGKVAHGEEANGKKRWGHAERSLSEPHTTTTGKGDTALIATQVTRSSQTGGNGLYSSDLLDPLTTITTKADHHLVATSIGGVGGRAAQIPERSPEQPIQTITSKADTGLFASTLVPRYGERKGQKPRCIPVSKPGPSVVPTGNGAGLVAANLQVYHGTKSGGDERVGEVIDPICTLDTSNRVGLVASLLTQNNGGNNDMDGREVSDPLSTILSRSTGHHGYLGIALDQANGGFENRIGRSPTDPLSTILTEGRGHQGLLATEIVVNTSGHPGTPTSGPTAIQTTGSHQGPVGVSLQKQRGTAFDADPQDPLGTVSAGGQHHGVVATELDPVDDDVASHIQRDFSGSTGSSATEPVGTATAGGGGHSALIGSFLTKYYGTGSGQKLNDPLHTAPTVDRFGLVTVVIAEVEYYVRDICMRMLTPRELYLCQGFRPGYIIDRGHDGRIFTKSQQVHMCGNSVSPPPAVALIRANSPFLIVRSHIHAELAREAVA